MEGELQKKLLKKAAALLARRAYSRGEMRSRLSKFPEEEVEVVLDRLEQLNLLNDAEYAYNHAFCRMKQAGWGPVKVHDFLLRHCVAPQLAESAIDRVRREISDGVALAEYLQRHCRKSKLPADPNGIRKLISHLRRRGFHENTIYGVLQQMIPAAIWRGFETGD